MLIRLGYDITFDIPFDVPLVALLKVHKCRTEDLVEPDVLVAEPSVKVDEYLDIFGNRSARMVAPAGIFRLYGSTCVRDSGLQDPQCPDAREVPVNELPIDALPFLLASRYCEVDLLSNTAAELFGSCQPGWNRVKSICDWINSRVTFGYHFARSTKTALDVYTERTGVCRDFQHLAVTFCRALNIPARYATGYLGDIGVPPSTSAMDFSAWFQAYLGDRWWTFDARHNRPRIGRVLMAVGRDAADVALTTSFGVAQLRNFTVVTEEVEADESGGRPTPWVQTAAGPG